MLLEAVLQAAGMGFGKLRMAGAAAGCARQRHTECLWAGCRLQGVAGLAS